MIRFYKNLKSWFWSIVIFIYSLTNRTPRSKGEREVIEYLIKHGIKFKRELCIACDGGFQRYVYIDFYLPKQKIFIEYNGRQHYEPVEYFGGEKQFQRQQKRDAWVREFCNKHHIKLIEIPYYVNVESYLDQYLLNESF